MQAATAKQYLTLNGRTVIETALNVLLDCHTIDRVVVCIAADDAIWPGLKIAADARVITVAGGAVRAQSVLNGLLGLAANAADHDWVLVHDAARPCLTDQLLAKLIATLRDDPLGGILALPAKDTLKLADREGRAIERSLDRALVWQAQTPQMFRYGVLRSALEQALSQNLEITDEASAMELAGYQPRLVEGESRNLKVTLPEDLQLAEFLLRR